MEDKKLLTLLSEFPAVNAEGDEAFSSLTINPTVTWIKFVLTDDKPNANRQRVPGDEFDNIIRTGTNMPIKMASGGIKDGHEESLPIGVITHLKKLKDQVIGLAALWSRERPEDVDLIKTKYSNREPLELSWELLYGESSVTDDGVEDLKDIALRAVTFVGRPAFEGRTPVLAVAAKTDTNLEDKKLEELEVLKQKVAELEGLLAEKDTALSSKDTELATASSELTELRDFKASILKEREESEKLDAIVKKFSEAGIQKDSEYFVSNKEMLLGLSEVALNFMLQELVAFSSVSKDATASKKEDKVELPDLSGEKSVDLKSTKTLASWLQSLDNR